MTTNILVIDDSMMVRKQVGNALRNLGHLIVEAIDGVDALEKLEVHPNTRLIVCDVNMPNMNGLEFLERLRARGSTVPVVMLTTEGQAELMQRARSLGAKYWLLKPFKPEILAATALKLAPVDA